MKLFLKRWLITAAAVGVASQIVFGIKYDALTDLIFAAFLLGILNAVVRPIMMLLALPLVVLSLGLFILVINALLLYFVGHLLNGFHVASFWDAFWGALIISIVSLVLNALTKTDNSQIRRRPPPSAPPPRRDDGQGPVIDV